jgi:DNA (cytosine-5)-methyltransferase 1
LEITLNELSLFTGAGGGLLGTKLLGWKAIGYVEKEPYCQKVIRQRIADGILDAAPIFGDIRKFISEGYAAAYTGLVDVVTGGFPCQAWSNAASGKNNGENMWPEMLKIIGIVCPTFVFSENVDENAITMAQKDLADAGYKTKRCKLSAADVGADHFRARWWLLAHADHQSKLRSKIDAEMEMREKFCCRVWESYPIESGMVDGMAGRMERFKAIGNGQVPAVVACAWRTLMDT